MGSPRVLHGQGEPGRCFLLPVPRVRITPWGRWGKVFFCAHQGMSSGSGRAPWDVSTEVLDDAHHT